MNKTLIINTFLILIFSYLSVSGIRLLPLFSIIILLLSLYSVFTNRLIITRENSSIFVILMLGTITTLSAFSGAYEVLSAFIIFTLILYWPIIIKSNDKIDLLIKIKKIYILSAVFLSVGVMIQFILHFNFDITFGKFDIYGGGRKAFGFLWSDYSFLSLYFVSCIPIIMYNMRSRWRLLIILVLTLGAITTTARTGIFSLAFALLTYVFLNIANILKSKRFYYGFFSILITTISFISLNLQTIFFNRKLTASTSGRLEGYYEALVFFLDNPLFGSFFNPEHYKVTVGVIPHNLIIYFLVVGGSLFTLLFLIWLSIVTYKVIKLNDLGLKYSYLICIIGFQLTPSFFSAYFFAVLLSMILLSDSYTPKRNTIL